MVTDPRPGQQVLSRSLSSNSHLLSMQCYQLRCARTAFDPTLPSFRRSHAACRLARYRQPFQATDGQGELRTSERCVASATMTLQQRLAEPLLVALASLEPFCDEGEIARLRQAITERVENAPLMDIPLGGRLATIQAMSADTADVNTPHR